MTEQVVVGSSRVCSAPTLARWATMGVSRRKCTPVAAAAAAPLRREPAQAIYTALLSIIFAALGCCCFWHARFRQFLGKPGQPPQLLPRPWRKPGALWAVPPPKSRNKYVWPS